MPNALSVPTYRGGIKPIASRFRLYAESGFTGRKSVTFMLPDKRTPAYFVDYRTHIADLVVHRGASSGPVVGNVHCHKFRPTEFVFANGQKGKMYKDGFFTRRHVVNLPAGPEKGQYFWKGTSDYGASPMRGGNLKLESPSGTVFAAYLRSSGSRKDGQLDILVEGLDQDFVDQIVVSLMAMAEEERRRRGAGAGAAGGGGGA